MRGARVVGVLAAIMAASPGSAAPARHGAAAEARAALEAMGGATKLQALRVVRWGGLRRQVALEQSIRPEGPWLDTVDDIVETRRFDPPALHDQGRTRGVSSPDLQGGRWTAYALTIVGDRSLQTVGAQTRSAGSGQVVAAEEALALGPERALLTALQADDLRLDAPRRLHGYAHQVLTFTRRGAVVRIFIEPQSHLPAGVEIVRPRPYDLFWNAWGDVDTFVDWEFWTLEDNGLRFPRQWTTTSNGLPEQTLWIDHVEFNPSEGSDFALPETAAASTPRAVDEALPLDLARRQTLAPGVRLLAGPWNVIEVVTAAGTYVIEGPISNRYSDQVMASVQAGGQRLLGVITTSDAWPHIAGLRAYAAAGVPIYAFDLNRPLLERLMAAPHRQRPDSLARRGRWADIRSVTRDLDLGSGPNRMRLIPLRTASGERQMAIYFPELKLLYTSDLFSVRPDGTIFLPEFLSEMRSVVLREGLDVKTAVGMHYGPADWTALGR